MSPEELRDYRNWHELTAKDVLNAVREIEGGWATVFKKGVPCWASRLRNYFNITPKFLKRYDSEKEWRVYHARLVNRGLMAWHALHGAVYQDKADRDWLQMATAAAVYHYQGEVNIRKEVGAYIKPQMMMPIFKLVSPDRTGGSREVILTNPKGWIFGDSTVADCDQWAYVRNRAVLKETYAGSYNYAETITRGYDAHKASGPAFTSTQTPTPAWTNAASRNAMAASHLKPVANPDLDPKDW